MYMYVSICVYVHVYMFVCTCVCVYILCLFFYSLHSYVKQCDMFLQEKRVNPSVFAVECIPSLISLSRDEVPNIRMAVGKLLHQTLSNTGSIYLYSVHLSVCLSACLSVYICIKMFVYKYVLHVPVCLSTCTCLSIYMCILVFRQ